MINSRFRKSLIQQLHDLLKDLVSFVSALLPWYQLYSKCAFLCGYKMFVSRSLRPSIRIEFTLCDGKSTITVVITREMYISPPCKRNPDAGSPGLEWWLPHAMGPDV